MIIYAYVMGGINVEALFLATIIPQNFGRAVLGLMINDKR